MRALTIQQPWATLVAIGAKRVETRSWGTGYRGPLAIHAALGFPRWAVKLLDDPVFYAALAPHFCGEDGGLLKPMALRWQLPTGRIVAVAELVDVGRITSPEALGYVLGDNEVAFGDYTPGRYAWVLNEVEALPGPIPARGALRLWEWHEAPAELARRPVR